MDNLEPEVVNVERLLACKIGTTDFATKITNGSSDLTTLESRIAVLVSKTNTLDDERFLLVPVQTWMDCKIDLTDYQTKVVDGSSSITTIESSLGRLRMKMNNLEEGVSLLL